MEVGVELCALGLYLLQTVLLEYAHELVVDKLNACEYLCRVLVRRAVTDVLEKSAAKEVN